GAGRAAFAAALTALVDRLVGLRLTGAGRPAPSASRAALRFPRLRLVVLLAGVVPALVLFAAVVAAVVPWLGRHGYSSRVARDRRVAAASVPTPRKRWHRCRRGVARHRTGARRGRSRGRSISRRKGH